MAEFRMPSLGADMEAGTLVEWLKAPGDVVARGDIIAVVETQKGAIEIECFDTGTLARQLVAPGVKVPVGTPLALIEAPGAADREPPGAAPPAAAPAVATASIPPAPASAPAPAATTATPGRLRISPAARQLAAARGLDLSVFDVAGPPIGLAEVTARLAAPPTPAAATTAPAPAASPDAQSDMRQAIAAAMARSKREIPHYYLAHQVDLTALTDRLTAINADRAPDARLLAGAAYLHALARTLARFPEFNGHFENGSFRAATAVHAGMAIRLRGGGLVAPAILEADTLSADQIMDRLRDIVARARAGRFRAQEFSAATITLSSLGDRGVDALTGVITPPQVAIVGIGTPTTRPWVVDAAVVPRQVATLTLAADHRVSDGHRGALFLRALATALTEPELP